MKSSLRTSAAAPEASAVGRDVHRVLHRDQDDDCIGMGGSDAASGLDPVHAGHANVDDHHVGIELGHRRNRLLPGCDLAQRLESRSGLDDLPCQLTKHLLVVDRQDAYLPVRVVFGGSSTALAPSGRFGLPRLSVRAQSMEVNGQRDLHHSARKRRRADPDDEQDRLAAEVARPTRNRAGARRCRPGPAPTRPRAPSSSRGRRRCRTGP